MAFLRRTCISLMAATSLLLAACVVEQPVPVPAGPSKYDRAWNAALGGVQDAGVKISSAEPGNGTIRGTKDGIAVTVVVSRQPDGSVQVRFDSKGPTENDPKLPERFSQAYERRMGR